MRLKTLLSVSTGLALLAFGLGSARAHAQETAPDSQTERSDESYEEQLRKRDAPSNRTRTPCPPGVPCTGGPLPPQEPIDKLPPESAEHIRRQRVPIALKVGRYDPSDVPANFPYQPSPEAITDPDLQELEREAWEDLVENVIEDAKRASGVSGEAGDPEGAPGGAGTGEASDAVGGGGGGAGGAPPAPETPQRDVPPESQPTNIYGWGSRQPVFGNPGVAAPPAEPVGSGAGAGGVPEDEDAPGGPDESGAQGPQDVAGTPIEPGASRPLPTGTSDDPAGTGAGGGPGSDPASGEAGGPEGEDIPQAGGGGTNQPEEGDGRLPVPLLDGGEGNSGSESPSGDETQTGEDAGPTGDTGSGDSDSEPADGEEPSDWWDTEENDDADGGAGSDTADESGGGTTPGEPGAQNGERTGSEEAPAGAPAPEGELAEAGDATGNAAGSDAPIQASDGQAEPSDAGEASSSNDVSETGSGPPSPPREESLFERLRRLLGAGEASEQAPPAPPPPPPAPVEEDVRIPVEDVPPDFGDEPPLPDPDRNQVTVVSDEDVSAAPPSEPPAQPASEPASGVRSGEDIGTGREQGLSDLIRRGRANR